MKTIVGLFDDMTEAKKAAHDLEAAGVPHNDISFVANNEGEKHVANAAAPHVSGHAIGHDAVVGAEIGGVAGLLLGLTAFAIPGLGWIAGAGWLMGMIYGAGTGAAIGGLVGALTNIGVPAEDAAHYNEGVRRGGVLLAIKAEDNMAAKVAQILGDDGAVNIDERAAQYKQEGFLPTPATPVAPKPVVSAPAYNPAPMPTTVAKVGETVLPVIEEELLVGKREVERGGVRVYSHVTETPGNGIPGIQTGGHDIDGTPDTRGITEKIADAVTGNRIDDKTGKPVA